jgi:hypothetical protein
VDTNRPFQFQKRSQLLIRTCDETLSIVAVRVHDPGYRVSVAAGADRGLFKSNETAFRLPVQIPDLRVFGSLRIWLTTPELFVATQRRYVLRVFPSYASGVSQWF